MTAENFNKIIQERLRTLYKERAGRMKDPHKAFIACPVALRVEVNAAVMDFAKTWEPPPEVAPR